MKVKICHHSTVSESLAGGSTALLITSLSSIYSKGLSSPGFFSTVGKFYEEWLNSFLSCCIYIKHNVVFVCFFHIAHCIVFYFVSTNDFKDR